ncbi:MAG: M56 family metallopeptidase [Flavobacteriaceae bacterium]
MVNYIIQVVLFQFLFIVIYDVFLRKETFFNANRAYLLLTPIVSFALPFIKITAFTKVTSLNFVEHLPAIILNPQESLKTVVTTSFSMYLMLVFLLGSLIMISLFIYKIASIYILRQKSIVEKQATHTLVLIDKKGIIFSFFKSIYIDKIFINQPHNHIIEHELIHIKQIHSLDLIFFEIHKILMWFNPAIYIFQNRITELHEFIADAKTIAPENKIDFFNRLLTTTFKVTKVDFVNQFYKHSLIKKRIMMTNKNKSKQVLKLKYLLLVPALASMLFYVSCQQKKQTITEQVASLKASIAKKDTLSKSEFREITSLLTKDLLKKIPSRKNSKGVEVEKIKGISFAEIDQAPIYPGCENAPEQRKCLSENITKLISQNFNFRLANNLDLKPGHKRIFVMFTINKNGKVTDVRARAPHKKLEIEAIRVIKLIPQLKPGIKNNGKVVAVKYSLPIVFNIPK